MTERLKILHNTKYAFEDEVFIEPHYLRFTPGLNAFNSVLSSSMQIFPEPVGRSFQKDIEGNLIDFCWFEGMHHQLSITSETHVQFKDNNPLDFIVFPKTYADMPFQYTPSLKNLLAPALYVDALDSPLIDYGKEILKASGDSTVNFLINLTQQIHHDFRLEFRLEGAPYPADQTFDIKRGSCRDLSWMQIQLVRHLGIAARFVSGYFFIESDQSEHDLHGWVECFIPGAGWVGFDPSHGAVAASLHVPVCSSVNFENTMPVVGSFRGDSASSLSTQVLIEKI